MFIDSGTMAPCYPGNIVNWSNNEPQGGVTCMFFIRIFPMGPVGLISSSGTLGAMGPWCPGAKFVIFSAAKPCPRHRACLLGGVLGLS